MYAWDGVREGVSNKFILSFLGCSNLKDDEQGVIIAFSSLFVCLLQIHCSQERTHLDVLGRFLRVTEAVYLQVQSHNSLNLLF